VRLPGAGHSDDGIALDLADNHAAQTGSGFIIPVKRQLGAYYTPDRVAQILVRWALHGRPGHILDPSFGGCSFLRASVEIIQGLGASHIGTYVHGVDVDEGAQVHAEQLVALGVPAENLIIDDFFAVEPHRFAPILFDAVVGNPPYVRHHWFRNAVRTRAIEATRQAGVEMDGRAGSWAYFVIHALRFLRPGGRLAFVLPGAVLQAKYADHVLAAVESRFARVQLVRLRERIFQDTHEESVILLASGCGGVAQQSYVSEATTVEDLNTLLANHMPINEIRGDDGNWRESLLTRPVQSLWRELQQHADLRPLGELARLRIGVVTGANGFFVRSAMEADLLRCPDVALQLLVSRGGWLKTARWTRNDQAAIDRTSAASRLLVVHPQATLDGRLAILVADAERQGVHERHKCGQRMPWYALVDVAVPDAFLAYMGKTWPRLTLNDAHASCTNAIHRVWWKDKAPKEAAIIGSWTSIFALGAELYGRSYGGGVLKVEPGTAMHLPVPIAWDSGHWMDDLDRLSRDRGIEAAREIADHVVLRKHLGLSQREVYALRDAVNMLAQRRAPLR